jgi:tetratricopeptide (TPR) repeat protein
MKGRLFISCICLLVLPACGGRKGIAPPRDFEKVITHRVGYGETWRSLSLQFYGDGGRAGALAVYNGAPESGQPEIGDAVRVPLSAADFRSLRARLDAYEIYNEGLDLAQEGDFAGAVECFRKVLKIDPRFSDASFNLAVTYQKLGLHRNAETVLAELVRDAATTADYLFALGNSRFHLNELEGALEAFTAAVSADPSHLKSRFSLAIVCEKLGRIDEAKAHLTRYLELDPDSAWSEKARLRLDAFPGPGRR